VLDRINETSRIFEAWSDVEWVNEGAAVRVSLVAFGDGGSPAVLNGAGVERIHADLTAGLDLTAAHGLAATRDCAFVATVKAGPFDIDGAQARAWLMLPNPNGFSNARVVKRCANGIDVVRRWTDTWVVDFGVDMPQHEAALFEAPYSYVEKTVKPVRANTRAQREREIWWRMARPIPNMRKALAPLERYIATVAVAKFRLFVWLDLSVLADHALIVFARADDTTFGILHSRFHELWSLRLGTSLEDRSRYTPTTCFETFPFPANLTPADTAHQRTESGASGVCIPADLTPQVRALAEPIARAAHRLVALREAWLNPPEWTERVPEVVPWA
jgi:hypothetical protein